MTGDGHTKMMMMINRQHPGPSIVVYEGQEVTYSNILVCAKPIRLTVIIFAIAIRA